MPSKKNAETEQTNPARSNPTTTVWEGAEHDIIKEVRRALISNGLLKEGS